jgi:hypothetical protein
LIIGASRSALRKNARAGRPESTVAPAEVGCVMMPECAYHPRLHPAYDVEPRAWLRLSDLPEEELAQ